ncbi:hypothetical protein P4O66_011610, partial [Electrophorus voltai]
IELIQVQQEPEELVLSSGSSLKVSCSITGTNNILNLYWYRWTPGAGFTLVFTSLGTGSVDPVSEGQFKSQRPEKFQTILESAGVSENGSAVWYCAASAHSIELIQVHQKPENLVLSLGTKLNVSCSIAGTTNPDLYWYRWTSAAGFTLVFTSRSVGLMDPVSEGQFRSQRPSDLQMLLESAGVNEIGSAVWYCAASPHSIIQVYQDSNDLVLSLGATLKVSCSITGTTNPDLYWYRWTSAAGFTLVFTSRSVGLVDPVSEGQFRSQRPADLQLVLESAGVNETGSAVWYCAASLHTIPEHTYSCTKTIPSQFPGCSMSFEIQRAEAGVGMEELQGKRRAGTEASFRGLLSPHPQPPHHVCLHITPL